MLLSNADNQRATLLRDQGKIKEARDLLIRNHYYLSEKAQELNSPLLNRQQILNRVQAQNIDFDWRRTRKLMMRDNTAITQQALNYSTVDSNYGIGYTNDKTVTAQETSQLIKIPNEPGSGSAKAGVSKP